MYVVIYGGVLLGMVKRPASIAHSNRIIANRIGNKYEDTENHPIMTLVNVRAIYTPFSSHFA